MRFNKFYTFLIVLLFSSSVFASSDIDFKVLVHDFGIVKEGDKATKVFDFSNLGEDSLQLENVRASCGCTVPNWPKNQFGKNESGEIKVTYNSSGRVGAFYKVITITTMEFEKVELVIKGVVISEMSYDGDNTSEMNPLTSEKDDILLGKLEVNKSVDATVTVKNVSNKKIIISDVQAGCRCVYTAMKNTEILPGKSADLQFKYTPRHLGEELDKMVILTNSNSHPGLEVTLKSSLVESFAPKSSSILNDGQQQPSGGAFGF